MTHDQLSEVSETSQILVAIAILFQGNRFLMQLRDDDPKILFPGHWGFFGGHLEPGEDAESGVRRELIEEIGYCPPQLTLFKQYNDQKITRYVYWGELGVDLNNLVLMEGIDLDLLNEEDIIRGDRYSTRINQVRSLGRPHREILLDFIRTRTVSR